MFLKTDDLIRLKPSMMNKIIYMVKDEALANDLYQETILSILSGNYKDQGKFDQWAFTICHNTVINHFMRKKKMIYVEMIGDIEQVQEDKSDLLFILDSSILTDRQRMMIKMKILADCTFREISQILRENIETVKGHYYRGIKSLRENMVQGG